MSIAYSYLRFSSEKQMDGNSIERQTEAARDWCKRNGVALDSVTTFRDLATPAFTGEHRKNPDRNALALFLQMALGDSRGEGRIILPGSYLIIESLDRLTREHVQPALGLIISLLQAGIRIVQLKPQEMIYDSKSDMLPLMLMIAELSRGHNESLMKSIRVRAAWVKKKELAREKGVIMSPKCPPWLRIVAGKYQPVASAVAIYRRIFQLSIEGMGMRSIRTLLNRERVHRPDKKGRWTFSYVAFCLRDRRFLGEHQPLRRVGKRVEKDGEPIAGYYPAIIDKRTWELSRDVSERRLSIRGRNGSSSFVNIFKGLLHSGIDGGSFRTQRRKVASGGQILDYRVLVNTKGFAGAEPMCSFRLDVFEYAILKELTEISVRDLQPARRGADELESLLAEERRLKARKAKIIEAMTESEEDIGTLAAADKRIGERLVALATRIAEERRKKSNATAIEWRSVADIAQHILENPEDEESRRRLRSALYRTIEGIWLVICGIPKSLARYCAVQVYFKDSPVMRDYAIWFRPAHYHSKSNQFTPAGYVCLSDKPYLRLDLRDGQQAQTFLSRFLAAPEIPHTWRVWPAAKRNTHRRID